MVTASQGQLNQALPNFRWSDQDSKYYRASEKIHCAGRSTGATGAYLKRSEIPESAETGVQIQKPEGVQSCLSGEAHHLL